MDALELARALIGCRSVTPADGGALGVLGAALEGAGFTVRPLTFGTTPNLFARAGAGGPHFCFAGHTDVVPPGEGWRSDPFVPEVRDGRLYGRGACDMKGSVAAFAAAAAGHVGAMRGSVSLLITGDEEGPATDGTRRVLEWMAAEGQMPDFCLVGEPTCRETLGDTVKIGRRGSLNATVTVQGVQGHTAYPQRADNPLHRLVAALAALTAAPLDGGTAWFEPSTLAVTSVDTGNAATNVIPARASARLNIRFNDRHSGASLEGWLRATLARYCPQHEIEVAVSGESFLTEPGAAVDRLRSAIEGATGVAPALDTGGGTSDARFIAAYCPVAEFGPVGRTMHQVDENIGVDELRRLQAVYGAILAAFA